MGTVAHPGWLPGILTLTERVKRPIRCHWYFIRSRSSNAQGCQVLVAYLHEGDPRRVKDLLGVQGLRATRRLLEPGHCTSE